jgi:glycosyltransferase involved in cell wall biosynthesis
MRVGVDGRAFESPAGGVRRYARELYLAMTKVDPAVEIVAIGGSGRRLPPGVRRRRAIPFPTNLGWMAASIPLAARRARLDVYHAPAYTAPLWGVHPQLLTIHDVSYERRPEWNAYKNDPLRRMFYRRSAWAADRIVTDSVFSRDEIVAAYGIPHGRIDVVPLAASAAFGPGSFDPAAAPLGVGQPYALHVGDLHVRRNLSTALAAVIAVRQRLSFEEPLPRLPAFVCVGIDRGIGDALRAQAAAVRDPAAVVVTGPVSETALLNLYRGASMLLYPSLYEGFGLPILEAMQCAVPVIGANISSIPELVGDAGLLVEPESEAAWTTAVDRLVTNPGLHAQLVSAGLRRAATFTWTRTAEQTLEALRRCLGPATPPSPDEARRASAGQGPPSPDEARRASAGQGPPSPDEAHRASAGQGSASPDEAHPAPRAPAPEHE